MLREECAEGGLPPPPQLPFSADLPPAGAWLLPLALSQVLFLTLAVTVFLSGAWPSLGRVQGLSRCPWTPDQGFGQIGGSPALSLSCMRRWQVPPAAEEERAWRGAAVAAAGQSPVCAPHSRVMTAWGGGGPDAGPYFATCPSFLS